MKQETKELLQWHPAFYASLKIEFANEAENLIFENEHALSNKPMLIDVLIIKKNSKKPIQKNIGKIFKGHNIIEYKSPTDYLSIDDFYKVYGYACFYKSDGEHANSIPIEEITITLACHSYPKTLMNHFIHTRGHKVEQIEDGIYYILGDIIPIQLLVTPKLSEEQNLWLKSLTNQLEDTQIKTIITDYQKHQNNPLYDAIMNLIIQANQKSFQEVNDMCEALEELMKDKIQQKEQEAMQRGMKRGMEQGIQQGMEQGIQQGIQQGEYQKLLHQIQKKMNKLKTIEQIAEELEETIDTITPLYYHLQENKLT